MRRFTYTNPNGESIVLGPTPANYMIESATGIDGAGTDIYYTKSPNQDGETYLDNLLSVREIVINGSITAPNDSADIFPLRRELVRVVNPKLGVGVLKYEYDGGTKIIHALPDGGPVFANRDFREPWQKYQVTFSCPSPLWLDEIASNATVGLTTANFSFPLIFVTGGIEFSVRTTEKERSLTNSGDVPVPVTITFFGPAVNPAIINQTTGEYIKVNITLDEGESMIIDTAFGQKTVSLNQGAGLSNGIQYLDLSSTFWQLIPGDNVITFVDDTDSTAPRCDVGWSSAYLGV